MVQMFKCLIKLYLKQPAYSVLWNKAKLKSLHVFKFQCHFLIIGGLKYPCYLKNGKKNMSNLYDYKQFCKMMQ